MANTYKKNEPLTEKMQQEIQDSVEEKANASEDFVRKALSVGGLSSLSIVNNLPFILFIAFLGVIYIANRHYAENTVRKISSLSKEVKVMSWEFKTLKADLMLRSTQSEVLNLVDTVGLKELVVPPRKIVIKKETDK